MVKSGSKMIRGKKRREGGCGEKREDVNAGRGKGGEGNSRA